MVVDEFETTCTMDAVISTIKSYRFRRHGVPTWSAFDEDEGPVEPGIERHPIDTTPKSGRVHIRLKSTDHGTRIVHLKTEDGAYGGKADISPEEYAREIAQAIKQEGGWSPIKPHKGASADEWCKYRFQMKKAGKRPPTYEEMHNDSNFSPGYLKRLYSDLGYPAKRGDKK